MYSLSDFDSIFDDQGQNFLVENKDFVLLPDENDNWKIRIETGPYQGVVYRYNKIKIVEQQTTARITFDYVIDQQPEDIILNESDFELHLSAILHSILHEVMHSEYEEEQVVIKEENGSKN